MLVFINSTDSINFNVFSFFVLSSRRKITFFEKGERERIASEVAAKLTWILDFQYAIRLAGTSIFLFFAHTVRSSALPWKVFAIYIQLASHALHLSLNWLQVSKSTSKWWRFIKTPESFLKNSNWLQSVFHFINSFHRLTLGNDRSGIFNLTVICLFVVLLLFLDINQPNWICSNFRKRKHTFFESVTLVLLAIKSKFVINFPSVTFKWLSLRISSILSPQLCVLASVCLMKMTNELFRFFIHWLSNDDRLECNCCGWTLRSIDLTPSAHPMKC